MGKFTEQLTGNIANTAGGLLDAGLGLILGKQMDKRQLDQQRRLQELQIEGQKEMGQFNLAQQMELWHKTNYKAQREELKKAGLNPGLLYGMSGGGGATAAASGGAVTGGAAPVGGGEVQEMMGLGMQRQDVQMRREMLQAQKEVLQTQAQKNEAEATKIKGIDTDEAQQRIQSLQAGIENTKAQTEIAKIEANLRDMEAAVKEATLEDSIDRIVYEAKQAGKQLDIVENEAYISRQTKDEKVAIIKQQVIQSALQSVLLRAQGKNTEMDTEVKKGQLSKMVADVMNASKQVNINERRLALDEAVKQWETNYPGISQTTGRIFNDIMEELPRIFGSKRPKYGNLETEKRK